MKINILTEYWPKRNENRLRNVGNVVLARNHYYKDKLKNLYFLLEKRYRWMNRYIQKGNKILEVGCGTGVAKDFIRKDCDLLVTDIEKFDWVDQKVDALDTKFPDSSFDVVFCSNTIHHLSFPKLFFDEMRRILKPGGYLLVQEINCSIMARFMLRMLRHEGWSFKTNVYSLDTPCSDETNPWTSNNAIPNLLFDDLERFKKEIPFFEIKEQKFSEFFIFPLSGGVIAKKRTLNLPFFLLKFINLADNFLVYLAPKFFALQRRAVLKKQGNPKESGVFVFDRSASDAGF